METKQLRTSNPDVFDQIKTYYEEELGLDLSERQITDKALEEAHSTLTGDE